VVLAVTSYQLLLLDRENQVQLVQSLYSENDVAAIAIASEIIAGRDAELWAGSRLVMKFGPKRRGDIVVQQELGEGGAQRTLRQSRLGSVEWS
jgi:hypothetical protein